MDDGTGFGSPIYNGTSLEYTETLADINKIYTFRVWAFNQQNLTSDYSLTVSAALGEMPIAPNRPTLNELMTNRTHAVI